MQGADTGLPPAAAPERAPRPVWDGHAPGYAFAAHRAGGGPPHAGGPQRPENGGR